MGGEALAVRTDVGALDALAAITKERFGDVTLLVNNAGIEWQGFPGNCRRRAQGHQQCQLPLLLHIPTPSNADCVLNLE